MTHLTVKEKEGEVFEKMKNSTGALSSEFHYKNVMAMPKMQKVVFNVGTGSQASIGEVVALAKQITKSNIKSHYGKIKPSQFEPKNWRADISKAKNRLGWKPKYDLRKGLEKDIKWFKENQNR